MIDTHTHLNFKVFATDYTEVINQSRREGVWAIVIVGASLTSSREAVRIAKGKKGCFASVGIHPHHAVEYRKAKKSQLLSEFGRFATMGKVVAIGETGLDYHHYKGYPPLSEEHRTQQLLAFRFHLRLARRFHLPVILHCREAYNDQIAFLKTEYKKQKEINGVFHCFEGDREVLREILRLGFFVGFTGSISYPENYFLHDIVRLTPLSRLLVETDSPFLRPPPYQGVRNTPSFVKEVINMIAQMKGCNAQEVEDQTDINAKKLFHI